jgi:hypothetical protein
MPIKKKNDQELHLGVFHTSNNQRNSPKDGHFIPSPKRGLSSVFQPSSDLPYFAPNDEVADVDVKTVVEKLPTGKVGSSQSHMEQNSCQTCLLCTYSAVNVKLRPH